MKDLSMKELTTIALLGVLILISGSFKIPSPIAGGEFQLSAPIAVLICACFGFKRYIIAGILASMLGMMLGMHNIINVLVQMVFRVVAGGTMAQRTARNLRCPPRTVAGYRCKLDGTHRRSLPRYDFYRSCRRCIL